MKMALNEIIYESIFNSARIPFFDSYSVEMTDLANDALKILGF